MIQRKRSAYVGFSLIALSATLVGCDDAGPPTKAAHVYDSVEQCRKEQPAAVCDAAWKQAQGDQATAPLSADRAHCEADWGAGRCQPTHQGGHDFFMPMMAGFMIANALQPGRDCGPGTGRDCGYGAHGVFVGSAGRVYAGGSYVGDAVRDSNGRFAPPRVMPVAEGPGGRLSPGATARGGFGRFFAGGRGG
jgi:uncharacterized protein YgiB involved in biofilm formation